MGYTIEDSIKVEDGKTFIKKERMQDIVYDCDFEQANLSDEEYEKVEKAEVVLEELEDTSRWSTHHSCVFKLNENFYRTHYSKGATESQDESPFEYDNDWIEVDEVEEKKVTVVRYVIKSRE